MRSRVLLWTLSAQKEPVKRVALTALDGIRVTDFQPNVRCKQGGPAYILCTILDALRRLQRFWGPDKGGDDLCDLQVSLRRRIESRRRAVPLSGLLLVEEEAARDSTGGQRGQCASLERCFEQNRTERRHGISCLGRDTRWSSTCRAQSLKCSPVTRPVLVRCVLREGGARHIIKMQRLVLRVHVVYTTPSTSSPEQEVTYCTPYRCS